MIWGDVGVGKTWFLRYELEFGGAATGRAGVIDALQGLLEPETIYARLCPIMEGYFSELGTSAASALAELRKVQLNRKMGTSETPGQEALADDTVLSRWKHLEYGSELASLYLGAMDLVGTAPLFVVLDNLDKASEDEQESVLRMAARLLRNRLIKLIVPLRYTSRLLGDRFAGLHEFAFRSLELEPLDIREMLRVRFSVSRDGADLSRVKMPDPASGSTHTFPELFDLLYANEDSSGQMINRLAGPNARFALHLVSVLLFSRQLRALRHIGDPEFAFAAWMLSDTGDVSTTSPLLLNLFDSEEDPPQEGYSLIRYRVLEYLAREGAIDASHAHEKRYFARLGYETSRVRQVLIDFLGGGLVRSSMGFAPDAMRRHEDLDNEGSFSLTPTGASYWNNLLDLMWYYVVAKRATRVPLPLIKRDAQSETEYLTHSDFVRWLREEEENERRRARYWDMHSTPLRTDLSAPWGRARAALSRFEPGSCKLG